MLRTDRPLQVIRELTIASGPFHRQIQDHVLLRAEIAALAICEVRQVPVVAHQRRVHADCERLVGVFQQARVDAAAGFDALSDRPAPKRTSVDTLLDAVPAADAPSQSGCRRGASTGAVRRDRPALRTRWSTRSACRATAARFGVPAGNREWGPCFRGNGRCFNPHKMQAMDAANTFVRHRWINR